MAGNKVSLFYIIGRLDWFVSKSQVGNGYTAGFLGVILEVRLNLLICVVTNNLYAVLICTNCTVSAQTPELTSLSACRSNIRIFYCWQGQTGYIVRDGNGEFFLWFVCPQVLIYSKDISRLSIFGAQSVTTAYNQTVFELGASQCSNNVQE